MMSEELNITTLRRAVANFSDPSKHEEYFELYTDNTVLHGYAGVEPGLTNIKEFYAQLWGAFPDASIEEQDVFAIGDKVVYRFVMHGTHQGNFLGVPPTGKPIALPGITILRFADGKCIERWSQADFLSVLQQIGALPAAA